MGWISRLRGRGATEPPLRAPIERSSPGTAALFAAVRPDESHSVLDLGSASDASLRIYGRFARRVRFADLLAAAGSEDWTRALGELRGQPDHPYDMIFGWDLFDRLRREERAGIAQRLAELSTPGARLHVVVDGSGTHEPQRFTLLDLDRVRCDATGPRRKSEKPLLPAEVERLLAPFQVACGFTLKVGVREYLAVRREARATSRGSRA